MAHQSDRGQVQGREDIHQVLRVPIQACVPLILPGAAAGTSTARQVEKYDPETGGQRLGHRFPDLLVAAKPMGQYQGMVAFPHNLNMVSCQNILHCRAARTGVLL